MSVTNETGGPLATGDAYTPGTGATVVSTTYDQLGRVMSVTDAAGLVSTTQYDIADRVAQ